MHTFMIPLRQYPRMNGNNWQQKPNEKRFDIHCLLTLDSTAAEITVVCCVHFAHCYDYKRCIEIFRHPALCYVLEALELHDWRHVAQRAVISVGQSSFMFDHLLIVCCVLLLHLSQSPHFVVKGTLAL